jgi:hypothetical protein
VQDVTPDACVALAAALLIIFSGCGPAESMEDEGAASALAVDLSAEQPTLPPTWTYEPEAGPMTARPIDWRRTSWTGLRRSRFCKGNYVGAGREWTDGGVEFDIPSVEHWICVYEDPRAAEDAYASMSLLDVASDDWPNLTPEVLPEAIPHDQALLASLHADEGEIACGLGTANGICAVWMFRGRYGRALTKLEFYTSAGGIRLAPFVRLLRSVDAHMAQASNK